MITFVLFAALPSLNGIKPVKSVYCI